MTRLARVRPIHNLVRWMVALALGMAAVPAVDLRHAPPAAWAAGYTVTDMTDAGDGTCDGTCTLREAIVAANSSGGADTIDFSSGGTIVLTATLPAITDPLTIDGSGMAVIVDGANAFRVFTATAPLTLTALTVQNGNAPGNGGGAYLGGTATISGTTFSNNTATKGLGGGAFFAMTATVVGSSFIYNTANTSSIFGSGGGAYFAGETVVTGTIFMSNTASGSLWASGGGATFAGAALVTGSSFSYNTANGFGLGGGASMGGPATVTASTFSYNSAGSGGGVWMNGPATVTSSTFSYNSAFSGGGAWMGDPATAIDSAFRSNTANADGGGARLGSPAMVSGTTFISNTSNANFSGTGGGGAYFAGVAALTSTLFMSNTSGMAGGGGYFIDGPVTLVDTSFVANTAPSSGLYMGGGGAYLAGTASLTGTTFISNTAGENGGGAYLGGPAMLAAATFDGNQGREGGGAYFDAPAAATLTGTVFTNNLAGAGGGAFFWDGTATLTSTTFITNSAGEGGGAYFAGGTVRVTGTTFRANTATNGDGGGGAYISSAYLSGPVELRGARFIGNSATSIFGKGGGVRFAGVSVGGPVTIAGADFTGNTASGQFGTGGSVYFSEVTANVTGTTFISNSAGADGGGLYLGDNATINLDNNVLAANQAPTTTGAAEISLDGTGVTLTGRHNTFAAATAGSGGAIRAGNTTLGQTAILTNTILDGYAVGVQAGPFTPTLTLEGVLWSNVTTATQGAGITVTSAYTGPAAFVDPDGQDYHLATASAARDVGLTTSLSVDFEGDPRPIGAASDLGADEYQALTPVAVDDTVTTPANTPVSLNVLANDSDPNADALAISAIGLPTSGSAAISGTTQIVYTPSLNFTGLAVFTYTVTDGALTNTATVTVTVNDAPTAVDDSASTPEDTPVTVNVLANDSDLNSDPLTVSEVSTPASGSTAISGTTQIVYTPPLNFAGLAVFTYSVTDGLFTSTATVTVTVLPVNDAPKAVDDIASTLEDNPVIVSVLVNDTDVDGPALSVSAVGAPANGSAVISGTTQIVYAPSFNFNGQAVFTYTVSDGALTDMATVTVTVTPVNDAPTISALSDLTITLNTNTGPLGFTVGDVEAGGAVTVTASSTNQALVPNANIGLGGSGTNRSVTVTPALGQSGLVTITLTVSDGHGGEAQATFKLTVIAYRLFLPLTNR